jgi:trehalose-6-phosphatase
MRISFDLDDTLICYDPSVPCETSRVPFWLKSWYNEPLRLGTVRLMQELQANGWDIWIYTTSYRSPKQVKRWFGFYGIDIAAVINQELHEQWVKHSPFQRYISKYPPAFEIVLHVDDLEGVKLEGEENGFEVVVVEMSDEDWTSKVLCAAAEKLYYLQSTKPEP